jgi:hypothetical protein
MSTVTPSNDFVQMQPEVQSSRVLSQPQLNEQEVKSMEDQQRRLKYFTDTTNEELQQKQEDELFINLSLVNLFSKMSSTIIAIINELLLLTKDSQFKDIVYIFIKNDRLVYIGILMVIISLAIYLIGITAA